MEAIVVPKPYSVCDGYSTHTYVNIPEQSYSIAITYHRPEMYRERPYYAFTVRMCDNNMTTSGCKHCRVSCEAY